MREALLALLVALPFGVGVATGASGERPAPLFRFQDPEIVESSGLALTDGGLVVTVNDSGDAARAFVVDPATGRTVGTTRWEGGAEDVEAVAPASGDTVYVGDIGDNGAVRDTISVVRVPVAARDQDVAGERFALRYADGPADAEALLVHPRTGRLVVVTKKVLGGQVYVAPEDLSTTGVGTLRPRGPVMSVVTDGAFLPDGDHLVLRDYTRAVVYSWPALEPVAELDLPEQRQGESLAVTGEGAVLVGSEGLRSPVYEVALPDLPAGPVSSSPSPSPSPSPSSSPGTYSREGREIPEDPDRPRDPWPWLVGPAVAVVALVVLVLSLRPPRGQRDHPR
ncbi:hypothetical protein GCM10009623_25320 [Nocardioides aestuarii]|uniref:WD40 repeat domain-containing protein n=1 Tax=Nocardioides aestuarii TaxID=252231 RepID=A0ABW4TPJ5_9ACTN